MNSNKKNKNNLIFIFIDYFSFAYNSSMHSKNANNYIKCNKPRKSQKKFTLVKIPCKTYTKIRELC